MKDLWENTILDIFLDLGTIRSQNKQL